MWLHFCEALWGSDSETGSRKVGAGWGSMGSECLIGTELHLGRWNVLEGLVVTAA